jgi:hypothetical protein
LNERITLVGTLGHLAGIARQVASDLEQPELKRRAEGWKFEMKRRMRGKT